MRVRPISGRLLDERVSSTVTRRRTSVSGRSGLSQRTSSTPGEPIEVESSRKPSAIIRIIRAQDCQPEPASDADQVRSGRWAGADKVECGIHMPSRWAAKVEERRAS